MSDIHALLVCLSLSLTSTLTTLGTLQLWTLRFVEISEDLHSYYKCSSPFHNLGRPLVLSVNLTFTWMPTTGINEHRKLQGFVYLVTFSRHYPFLKIS